MRIILTVPCYNEEHRLDAFLDSVRAQTIPVEVIAVDDGSRDGTYEKLEKSNLLHVDRNERNLGTNRTYNKLMKLAETFSPDYLAWSGADDELYPDSIERRLAALKQSGADILVTGSDTRTRERRMLYPEMPPQHTGLRRADFSRPYEALLPGNILQVPILADMRRVSYNEMYYIPELRHLGDWEQQLRLTRLYKYSFLDESTGCSDWDGTNFSAPNPSLYPEKFRELAIILWKQTVPIAGEAGMASRVVRFVKLMKHSIEHLLKVNQLRMQGKTCFE
ncbi:MAG: glycosyltransferase family 2 protein [Verrucomicrobia bacterium]|nr:glycosyltransferase family 2 protein [Verrucomicrobiota bacterium]